MIHSCPHCSKPIEVKNGGKTVSEPGKKVQGHRQLGDTLFKEILGIEGRGPISAAHRRYGREVRDILAITGSPEQGLQAAKEVVAWLKAGGLSWTLSTVANHVLIWKSNRKEYLPKNPATYGVPERPKVFKCRDSDCDTIVKCDGDICEECLPKYSGPLPDLPPELEAFRTPRHTSCPNP